MRSFLILVPIVFASFFGCSHQRKLFMPTTTCVPGPVTRDTVAPGKSIEYTGVSLLLPPGGTEQCQLYRFNGFRYPELNPGTPPVSDYKLLLCSRGTQARAHIHHSEEALVVEDGVAAVIGITPIIYVHAIRLGSSSSTLAAETCPEGAYLYFVRGHGAGATAKVAIEGSTSSPVVLTPGQFVLVTNPSTSPVIGPPQNIGGNEHARDFLAYLSRRATAAGVPLDHDGGWGSPGGTALLDEPKDVSVATLTGAGSK